MILQSKQPCIDLKKIKVNHNFFLQINEAYDEVDEQKKDTAQWKNKYKKVQVFVCFFLF